MLPDLRHLALVGVREHVELNQAVNRLIITMVTRGVGMDSHSAGTDK
jgi:hypothetical protein